MNSKPEILPTSFTNSELLQYMGNDFFKYVKEEKIHL